MKNIRCSSLPLIAACPQAAQPCATPVAGSTEAADVGSAVHQVLTSWIGHGLSRDPAEEIELAARRWHADGDEVTALVWRGWGLWNQVAHHFPAPWVEVELRFADEGAGLVLAGHADVLSVVGDQVRVCDLKTGRRDDDHWPQVRGYCILALGDARWPSASSAYGGVLRIRDGVFDGRTFGGDELHIWYAGLVRRLKDERYRPGRQCAHCPRSACCPAVADTLRQSIDVLTDPGAVGYEELAAVYDALKQIDQWSGRVRDALRAYVAARGPTDLGDGRQLVLETSTRREIVYERAAHVLRDELGADELARILRVGKTDVEQLVKNAAPRGRKGAAVAELFARLEAADALIMHESDRLECRRNGEMKPLSEKT